MENPSVGADEEERGDGTEPGLLTIDCERCIGLGTMACEDCVVTFLCGRQPNQQSVVVDAGEARALRLLAGAGLIPVLRHERRTG